MNSPREFIVSGVVVGASGVYHVIGRCGDLSIHVGDVFQQLEHPAEPNQQVQLTVDRIQAYERSFEELGSGMTGTLDLRGAGVERLRPHSILLDMASVAHASGEQTTSQSTAHA